MSYEEERARLRQEAKQDDRDNLGFWLGAAAKVIGGLAIGISVVVIAWGFIGPQLRLYKANTEKQAAVAEAKAVADSARYLANAEIVRAEGVAEANRIIADSITDEYTRWLYVDQLDEINGQIIYVPTEAGIPILEAGQR